MFYFKKHSDPAPVGIIPLENLLVEKEDKVIKHGFRLVSTDGGFIKSVRMVDGGAPKKGKGIERKKRKTLFLTCEKGNHTYYVMGASCAEEQIAWIDALNKQIHRSPFYELLLAKKKPAAPEKK